MWFERFAPIGVALIVPALCYFFQDTISAQFLPNRWNRDNLYAAVFNWSSIQSGFVFAIYGFIVTKRDGFIGKIIAGGSYERFLVFTKRACFGGFALTIASLPLLVTSPKITFASPATYALVTAWFTLFVWAFSAFLRVAFSFGIIVATPDMPERVPG